MRVLELIHDLDHPQMPSNVDIWIQSKPHTCSEKILVQGRDEFPEFDRYDLLILHGGSQHLWDKASDPWLYQEVQYVRMALKRMKPVIGLCLGSQIIAEALGARVYQASRKEVGFFKIQPRSEARGHPLLRSFEEGFNTFLYHTDHYQLPRGCISLAYTEASANQIFISNRYPAVGFQFHPEYTRPIIKTYCEEKAADDWVIEECLPGKTGFLEQLRKMPDTYDLFKTLMNNSCSWICGEFGLELNL